MSSSPSALEGSATSPVNRDGQRDRRFGKHGAKRGKLVKNGTFVLPSTGERLRRQITLRHPSGFDGPARAHSHDEGFFCGGGLGFIGWFKQAYNAPLVSVACSLASLAIITVLTKENAVQVGAFSGDKIVQVMKMVIIMGMTSTSVVSLLAWPISARAELRESMIKTTDSFGDMLTMITGGFLSGAETDLRSASFNQAQKKYKSAFSSSRK
ncbi:hypothetical protein DID88_005540 [Monilinia fructigena]|uniref:Uncharacterized protein n=1 Tax=Monilinia fructigena TaxID=38457 RepID=A0A395J033_9HELO|nr:hypothetical protein DID88_005540 [Monilinia fructigena]